MIKNPIFSRNRRSSLSYLLTLLSFSFFVLAFGGVAVAQTTGVDPEPAAEAAPEESPAEETAPAVEEAVEETVEEAADEAAAELEEETKEELGNQAQDAQENLDAVKSDSQEGTDAAKKDLETMATESEDALMMSTEGVDVAPSKSSEAMVAETVDTDAAKSAFSALVVLDNSVGVGTFVEGSSQRPSYTVSLDMRPQWKLSDTDSVRLRLVVYSGVVQNVDSSTTTKNQVLLNDIEARFNRATKSNLGDIKLTLNPYAAVTAPTSLASRYATKVASVRGGYAVTGSMGGFSLTLDSVATKNFHRYTSPAVQNDDNVAVMRLNGAEDLGDSLTAIGRNNIEWSWSNRATTSITLSDTLTLGVTYVFLKSWTYVSYPDDELKQEQADAGRGVRDLVQGVADLYWQSPVDNFALDVGVTSAQAPLTADNDGVRFPFFDYKSTADNYTSVYLSAYYSF